MRGLFERGLGDPLHRSEGSENPEKILAIHLVPDKTLFDVDVAVEDDSPEEMFRKG